MQKMLKANTDAKFSHSNMSRKLACPKQAYFPLRNIYLKHMDELYQIIMFALKTL